MRGSVYYQVTQLIKSNFIESAKKIDRIDPQHPHFNCIASFETAATYRRVWENMFLYLREHWKLKNIELIKSEHVEAYLYYKVEYFPSLQYIQKINSAISKLEFTLNKFSINKYGFNERIIYDFSISKNLYNHFRNEEMIVENYIDRCYDDPQLVIDSLENPLHRDIANVQLHGGARIEGAGHLKAENFKGYEFDEIENRHCGVLWTKEKGGKEGPVYIPIELYYKLQKQLSEDTPLIKVNYQLYADDIRQTCHKLGIKPQGGHAFRHSFARRRMIAYQKVGYSYEESLLEVSNEMKHNRKEITLVYL